MPIAAKYQNGTKVLSLPEEGSIQKRYLDTLESLAWKMETSQTEFLVMKVHVHGIWLDLEFYQ